MQVLVTSRLFGTAAAEQLSLLATHGIRLINHPLKGTTLGEADFLDTDPALLSQAEALVCGDDEVTKKVIAQCPRLRLIFKHGIGVDRIDMTHASERRVWVANAPAANAVAVAEFSIALMLDLSRRITWMNQEVQGGHFPTTVGRQLSNAIVGIVGFGHIGRAVAQLLRPFGSRILMYDPFMDKASLPPDVESVTWKHLIRSSSIITFHAPLTKATRGMVNRRTLSLMRPDVLLINTARGQIFHLSDVQAWVREHPQGGVGLDTFPTEPPPLPPLVGPNVVLTAHAAGLTHEFLESAAHHAVTALIAVLDGRRPPTALNNLRGSDAQ